MISLVSSGKHPKDNTQKQFHVLPSSCACVAHISVRLLSGPNHGFIKYRGYLIEFVRSEAIARRAYCAHRWLDDRFGHLCPAVIIRTRYWSVGCLDCLGHRGCWNADAGLRVSDAISTQTRSEHRHQRLRQGRVWRLSGLCFGGGLPDRVLSSRRRLPCAHQGHVWTVLSNLWQRYNTRRDRCGVRGGAYIS
jgi:hypothetical protein